MAGNALGVAMHADQLPMTVDMVRALVAEQFPRWRSLPIERVSTAGTVNALFRLGNELVIRLPLRHTDADTTHRQLLSEFEAAGELLHRTRFPTPEPVALGEPGAGYPLPWSIQTWVTGTPASSAEPGDAIPFAHDLAEFIRDLRAIDTGGRTFSGTGRGGNLHDHDGWMETCFDNSEHLLDVALLRRRWHTLRDLPAPSAEVMTHGDLIPNNVLVCDQRLAGVIDVGGFGPADPALDLVGAWHLLDDTPRQSFRDDLGCSDLEWERGKAWAFEQSMGLVWYYVDSNPALSRLGVRTLERILSDSRA